MSIKMDRNPQYPASSNTLSPSSATIPMFKFYTVNYTGTGAKETIYLADTSEHGVMISPTGGAAQIEFCMDSPDVIETGVPFAATWVIGTPASVTVATTATVLGPTAIRVNATAATSCKLSVRC
jgi:hypothetical protein